jgi:hypothetical protein
MSLVARHDLVHLDRVPQESGVDQARLTLPEGRYTGIWWYARFPNHDADDGAVASRELGEFGPGTWVDVTALCWIDVSPVTGIWPLSSAMRHSVARSSFPARPARSSTHAGQRDQPGPARGR